MATFSFGAGTSVGNVREHNEDSYHIDVDRGLWMVADGMGGHAAGEVASGIAKQTIEDSIKRGEDVEDAIQQAHFAVQQAIEEGSDKKGMGTTVVAVQFDGLDYKVAWVGDSRAYLWDAQQENQLSQISKDQSLVQMLVDAGGITQEQARYHPRKNIITQYVGQPEVGRLRIDSVQATLESGQKIILCSDGLSDEVSDDEITSIMQQGCDNQVNEQEIADALIEAAIRNGGRDNVTVIVVSQQ